MNKLLKYKTAIFDCDGVILDSNQIKSYAFKAVLKDYPSHLVHEFIDYHKQNGGISRYQKFSYFFEQMLKIENPTLYTEKALKEFGEICLQELSTCSEISGVRNVLNYLKTNDIPCYVISGGDEEEIKTVFEKRSLTSFFKGIFGSPNTKEQHLKKLLDNGSLQQPLIFFGDSKLDYEVSMQYNCDFAFVYGASEWHEGLKIVKQSSSLCCKDFRFFQLATSNETCA